MIRFASLGSGSRGNAMVVQSARTTVLIDCGFGQRELVRRLGRLGLGIDVIDAILVTHEHGDHISGAAACARRCDIPLYMTHGTRSAGLRDDDSTGSLDIHLIDSHAMFGIGDFEVQPFPVPHDAREPVQFILGDGQHRFGMLTDIGVATPHVIDLLSTCNALVLECNHDARMLADGNYPFALKKRIAGRFGHLENDEAAGILARLDQNRLQHVLAAHLSEHNNTPALAGAALATVLGCDPVWIGIASQDQGSEWRTIA
ncbi:MAG: MBL fold metallo-hydrolase [Georgfuchsia sp.]